MEQSWGGVSTGRGTPSIPTSARGREGPREEGTLRPRGPPDFPPPELPAHRLLRSPWPAWGGGHRSSPSTLTQEAEGPGSPVGHSGCRVFTAVFLYLFCIFQILFKIVS